MEQKAKEIESVLALADYYMSDSNSIYWKVFRIAYIKCKALDPLDEEFDIYFDILKSMVLEIILAAIFKEKVK